MPILSQAISGGSLQMKFGQTPLTIASLTNLGTGAQFCQSGTHSVVVRIPGALSDPVFLTELVDASPAGNGISITLRDAKHRFTAGLGIEPSPDGLACHLNISSPEPVWAAEYRLEGLDFESVILPALGGQALSALMPPGAAATYKYPSWLNAQFVLGMTPGGGMWLRSKDVRAVFKYIRVGRSGENFALAYGIESDGPLRSKTLEATWYLDCFEGSWKVPVDVHRSWLEQSFSLVPFQENTSVQGWVRNINFILQMWGIGRDTPGPFLTFDQMIVRLIEWKKLHEPGRTLVYLPGFAEHGIGSRAPDYAPSPQLGGAAGFKKLVDTAHQLGYHVMVHTNVLGMTFHHPLYWRFEHLQVVDVFGRHQGWGYDIDGDGLHEPHYAYINPGAKEWGELMEAVIGGLIRLYGVDGIFLDQTCLAFNLGRGPNFVHGMREHILRLRQLFPATLFAGEGVHEQVLSALPFAQIQGLDGISGLPGTEGRLKWRTAHPISTYLFGRYTRFIAHLLTCHPSHPLFSLQESSYAKLGVIPGLSLDNNSQPMDTPAVRKMIRRANRM